VFPKGKHGQPDRATIDAAVPTLQKQIGILDAAVAKTGYLSATTTLSPTSTCCRSCFM
jgi:hypothetical protein